MSDIILPGKVEKQLEREQHADHITIPPANDPAATDAEWEAMHGGAPGAGPAPELLIPSAEVLARRKVKLNALEAMVIMQAIRQTAEMRGYVDEMEVSAVEQIASVFSKPLRAQAIPKGRVRRKRPHRGKRRNRGRGA